MMNRREFLSLSALSLVNTMFTSQSLDAQNFIKDLELGNRTDQFAIHARIGEYAEVDTPVLINFDDKSLQLWVYVSPNVPRAKLLVFSHDILVEPQIYLPLFKFLTTHGYAVVAPVHEDSFLSEGLSAQENDILGNTSWDFSSLSENSLIWEKRTDDCNKAVEKTPEISNTLATAIDYSYPVIIGHGLGAFTTQLLLGAPAKTSTKENGKQEIFQLENSYWGAAVLLSPYGSGMLGLSEDSWKNIEVPFLIVTGKEDRDLSLQDFEKKSEMYYQAPGFYRHLGILEKGDHTIFSGQRAIKNTKEYEIFKDIKGTINLFLSAYMNANADAYDLLYDTDKFFFFTEKFIKLQSR